MMYNKENIIKALTVFTLVLSQLLWSAPALAEKGTSDALHRMTPPAANITSNYASQNIITTPRVTTDYDSLPLCPGDASAELATDNVTGFFPAKEPYCPNINHQYTGNLVNVTLVSYTTTSTGYNKIEASLQFRFDPLYDINGYLPMICPVQCKTSRRVFKQPGTDIVTAIIYPICPQGYVKVAEYNAQLEYIKPTTTIRYPDYAGVDNQHLTLDRMTELGKKGYHCTVGDPTVSDSTHQIAHFRGCNLATSAEVANYRNNIYHGSRNTDTTYNGYVGQWYDYTADYGRATPEANYNSDINVGWYAVAGMSTGNSGYCYYYSAPWFYCNNIEAGDPHPQVDACFNNGLYSVWMDYGFKYYTCTANPDTYIQSDYSIPTTYVCARVVQGWERPAGFVNKF